MTISFNGNKLTIDGETEQLPWPVLNAVEKGERIFVLFDPDSYLYDSDYIEKRMRGMPAIKNLVAITKTFDKIWEAEMPELSDYYYHISLIKPLTAISFSSYRCEIDTYKGKIAKKGFIK